jgi:urease alpha subunit
MGGGGGMKFDPQPLRFTGKNATRAGEWDMAQESETGKVVFWNFANEGINSNVVLKYGGITQIIIPQANSGIIPLPYPYYDKTLFQWSFQAAGAGAVTNMLNITIAKLIEV